VRQGNRVIVDVLTRDSARRLASKIPARDGRVIDIAPDLGVVTVAVDPARLTALASVDWVQTVREDLAPGTSATCQGSIVSEGDSMINADDARSAAGVDGSGVTVGVISDSFDLNHTDPTDAAGDVSTHDLPGPGDPCGHTSPVGVLDDSHTGFVTDEGRAMLQVVHDVAPGAALKFATGKPTQQKFADNIQALANAGADVIVDDLYYLSEPFFQDGPIAKAANQVASEGVTFVSAAGNDNVGGDRSYGSFEAPAFRDAGSCPAGAPASAQHCMDWDETEEGTDDTYEFFVLNGANLRLDIQWAQPWYGVTTDLNAYAIDSQGNLLASAENVNVHGKTGSTEQPFEFLFWHNDTGTAQHIEVAIDRCTTTCRAAGGDAATPRVKTILSDAGGDTAPTEYGYSVGSDIIGPSIYGHSGTSSAISTAATSAKASSSSVESYSSGGPLTLYYQPVNGTTAAAPLVAPEVLAKPDITAPDCVLTTFFGGESLFTDDHIFCGTSAAAPHAAAVAALQLDADPSLTPAQVLAAQTENAAPFFPPERAGAGLLDALATLQPDTQPDPPTTTIDSHPKTKTSKKRATFTFSSTTISATFECHLDSQAFASCVSPQTYSVKPGKHTFKVKATDDLAQTGPAASFSWTYKKRRR
jgi:subtilisin family serine protease